MGEPADKVDYCTFFVTNEKKVKDLQENFKSKKIESETRKMFSGKWFENLMEGTYNTNPKNKERIKKWLKSLEE